MIMTHLHTQLTVKQRSYYEDELRSIRNGGRCTHEAFLIDKIWGMGSYDLGPVDPPVVGFCNNDDSFYIQYFKNWDEVEALIAQLREEATKAWGPVK